LKAAVDVVGISHVGADVIELRDWNVVQEAPVVGLIERLVDATVVTAEHLTRIVRIDPERVKIAVHALVGTLGVDGGTEALAAVFADGEKESGLVNAVGIFRIDDHAREVEGAAADVV
jgi:hypothetical protein